MSEPIGILMKDSLSISRESMMPESCEDCRLNESCQKIPRWLDQKTLSELYIKRLDTCPLQEVNEKPEIIYCGECKHMKANGHCDEFADERIFPSASDFCSAAERREDGRSD